MSTAPSPKRLHNDENSIPAHHRRERDALAPIAPSPSPRPRQPLAPYEHPPNLFSARYPGTPGHAGHASHGDASGRSGAGGNRDVGGGAGSNADATPVRSLATKVNPDVRELPLPKGLSFAAPPPPATALLPLPTPPHPRSVSHPHPSPLHARGAGGAGGMHSHHHHHAAIPHHMNHTPRPMHMSPVHHSTPIGRSLAMSSYSSPSTMSHMPSTPDIHRGSPYPPGPIDLHELLPPARFPGPLPQAFLNQGEMPSQTNDNDDGMGADNATPNGTARRTLVSCNPWDYRPEDHGKNKPRRRFSPGELDMLEILWGISHNPHKWQRQKLARWFGCTTRHLTVWFQNRRQDLKKAETLVQMAESNPDTASRALAAVQRANRGDQAKYTQDQAQVIMDIVSDRLLPEMWFAQQPSGSSPTPGQKTTPSPPNAGMPLPERRMPYTPAPLPIAPKPYLHQGSHSFPVKSIRRGYSLDDVCADREQSMTHRSSPRPRPRVEGFEQMHKNDPRYREALINMLPSELSSDVAEPPEDVDDDESIVGEDSPTRKRARHSLNMRAPRPTLPPVIGLGRPPHAGHRPRSSFGRASSSDVLACSSRARYLVNNSNVLPGRSVTDPVGGRSISAGPVPRVPEHSRAPSATPPAQLAPITDRKRKLARQGSWSHVPVLKHKDSFDRAGAAAAAAAATTPIEEGSSPVPEATRSPTPTDADSISPKTAPGSEDAKAALASSTNGKDSAPNSAKPRLPLPEGRSIYSFSTELEPETKRGNPEMDENVLTGAHALMELLRGR